MKKRKNNIHSLLDSPTDQRKVDTVIFSDDNLSEVVKSLKKVGKVKPMFTIEDLRKGNLTKLEIQ